MDETTHTQRGSSPKPSTQFSLYPGSGQQEDIRSLSLEPRQKRITAVITTRVVEVPTSPSGQCILMEDFKVNSGSTTTNSQRNANLRAVPADQWKKSLVCRHKKHGVQVRCKYKYRVCYESQREAVPRRLIVDI